MQMPLATVSILPFDLSLLHRSSLMCNLISFIVCVVCVVLCCVCWSNESGRGRWWGSLGTYGHWLAAMLCARTLYVLNCVSGLFVDHYAHFVVVIDSSNNREHNQSWTRPWNNLNTVTRMQSIYWLLTCYCH